jgi:hypothetical protein
MLGLNAVWTWPIFRANILWPYCNTCIFTAEITRKSCTGVCVCVGIRKQSNRVIFEVLAADGYVCRNTVWTRRYIPAFRRNILPPSSGLIRANDRHSKFLHNVRPRAVTTQNSDIVNNWAHGIGWVRITTWTEQGSSWQADNSLPNQEFSHILWNLKVCYRAHESSPQRRSYPEPNSFHLISLRSILILYSHV